jgi:hypothetical protein
MAELCAGIVQDNAILKRVVSAVWRVELKTLGWWWCKLLFTLLVENLVESSCLT